MKTNVSNIYQETVIIYNFVYYYPRIDMISDNEPILTKYISVPKELSQLNCNAFVAGIVEAVLDGCQFVSTIGKYSL
jgi:hypothetical protein